MNNLFFKLLLILILTPCISLGQFSFETSLNRNSTANNQVFGVKFTKDKFSARAAVKYMFNKRQNFPQSVFFKRTFWALDTKEHYGFDFQFCYTIWDMERVHFDVFYNFQYTKSSVRFFTYFATGLINPDEEPQSEFDYYFIQYERFIRPARAFEHNFGIQLKVDLTKNLYFMQNGGVGLLFSKEFDPTVLLVGEGRNWDLGEMFSFGFGWTFNTKKK